MTTDQNDERARVPALRFKQWLADWDAYPFDDAAQGRRPGQHLYLFSMRAAELRKLCDVYRRTRDGANAEGIQRQRDPSRTGRIKRYVRYGYPYGDLKPAQQSDDAKSLLKPGWLPTAIVVNILTENDLRRGRAVSADHLIKVEQEGGRFSLTLPSAASLENSDLAPLEVIDGQHRLWAFEEGEGEDPVPDDFELPVVAYHGLDVAWQAYLFWSINVSPKKINPSHAFDLYPLLRTRDWLERTGDISVYREARAQELTEIMYAHPASVWNSRINMLGERGGSGVTQASWVRGLLGSFLATGRGSGRKGLFQANLEYDDAPLEWSRAQQAAFLLQVWEDLRASFEAAGVAHSAYWMRGYGYDGERAFGDRSSIVNQDQGVRAVLAVTNDIFYSYSSEWNLDDWYMQAPLGADTTLDDVTFALESLGQQGFRGAISDLANALTSFDWRSLDGPGVKDDEDLAIIKRSYRGSGGYSSLRLDILKEVSKAQTEVGAVARQIVFEEA